MSDAQAHKKLTQRKMAEAALQNEQLTRERVERLEERVGKLEGQSGRHKRLRDRLKWVLRGE